MFAAVKSEIRKILTVRSTYAILLVTLLLLGVFSFYGSGWRVTTASLLNPDLLKDQIQQAVISTGLLGSIVGLLLVTHEYRYNTIMYTLTASNSRTKSFFAKLIAVTGFSIVFTLFVAIAAPLLTVAGIAAKGLDLSPQTLSLSPLFWQVLFVGWAYSILSFVFAMLLRVQVGAISAMFLFPAMIEPLLGLAMKKDAVYLPYNALQSVLITTNSSLKEISNAAAVGVAVLYVGIGLLVSWLLFLRRDAQ